MGGTYGALLMLVSFRFLLMLNGLKILSSKREASYIDFDAYSTSSIVGSLWLTELKSPCFKLSSIMNGLYLGDL